MAASMSPLIIPIWNQRNPQWSGQRLGTVDGTTIGGQGCLITCLAMAQAGFSGDSSWTPNVIDDKFTQMAGYANGNLVIWNAINRLLPEVATVGVDYCGDTPAPIQKIKAATFGGGLALLQVGFGGNSSAMHWLLAVGFEGDEIIFNDPWYGDQARFSSRRYGSGDASRDILSVHYLADGNTNTPIKPEVPVAKLPSENPVPLPTIPEPVVEELPTPPIEEPVGTVEPEVIEPVTSTVPEWVITWNPDTTIPPQIVSALVANIYDAEANEVVGSLTQGTLVKPLAGYFRANDVIYVRTQNAVDRNKWTGLRQLDIRDYTPTVNTTVPVDAIQAPAASPFLDYEEAYDRLEQADTALKGFWESLVGVFMSSLRLVGLVRKALKKRTT